VAVVEQPRVLGGKVREAALHGSAAIIESHFVIDQPAGAGIGREEEVAVIEIQGDDVGPQGAGDGVGKG
jgi:hypothetical protein